MGPEARARLESPRSPERARNLFFFYKSQLIWPLVLADQQAPEYQLHNITLNPEIRIIAISKLKPSSFTSLCFLPPPVVDIVVLNEKQ